MLLPDYLVPVISKKGPRAKSNGKSTSNGKCSTSHNQFLQAHYSSGLNILTF